MAIVKLNISNLIFLYLGHSVCLDFIQGPTLDSTWCDETFKLSNTIYHELKTGRQYLALIDEMCPK